MQDVRSLVHLVQGKGCSNDVGRNTGKNYPADVLCVWQGVKYTGSSWWN